MLKEGEYDHCSGCGLVTISAPISYDLDNYTRTYRSLFGTDLEIRINLNRVALVMRHLPLHSRILDYGCSCGNFLVRLEANYQCAGHELSNAALKSRICDSTIYNSLEEFRPEYFDGITLFDVWEHFRDPVTVFSSINALLKPMGFLFIVSPNIRYADDVGSWYHTKSGEHAHIWTPYALKMFLRRYGYIVREENYLEGLMRQNCKTADSIMTLVFQKI
jgi:2-polyprenyl-3-methyl-5-hydroxy-6-metoxy-1,4-benzoquinol methylase